MQARLGGSRPKGRTGETSVSPGFADHQVILGIDPSLRSTGYGVIRLAKPFPSTLAQGTIHCPREWPRSRCLARTAEVLREVIRKHRPTACAVEGLFFAQNLKTALIMGEARGACLLTAGEAGLEVYEIAARKVKQAIVGFGGAQKVAVAKMVQRILHLEKVPMADAADALALALALVQENRGLVWRAPKRI
ncbi:MAG: crossover junction endodeoxyribonuclease RuvC [Candidatus Omnitrophica bacterium]|nr:crossover junction endodeoxyribonuclease RuvC [Candidatus Omnitrophota bacterium]